MKVLVLGSSAGGGFPQWNCNCQNCNKMRSGTLKGKKRTQSSLAISSEGKDWVLINASPDIRSQLESDPSFQPAREPRDTSIVGVILIDSQIDHTAGLLSLREGKLLNIYCTDRVKEDLTTQFSLFPLLNGYCKIEHNEIFLDKEFTIPSLQGITFKAIDVQSAAPPYSLNRGKHAIGNTIGLLIRDNKTHKTLFYAPGLGVVQEKTQQAMQKADIIMVDGTFWEEDDMEKAGVGLKKAKEMGHLPLSGEGGMLEVLQNMTQARKILIHINNTNPILDPESPQFKRIIEENIEVAFDGMKIDV